METLNSTLIQQLKNLAVNLLSTYFCLNPCIKLISKRSPDPLLSTENILLRARAPAREHYIKSAQSLNLLNPGSDYHKSAQSLILLNPGSDFPSPKGDNVNNRG